VVEVLVEPGSRVKKGQPLVKLDDDEPQADVRAKQAALENVELVLQEARRHLTVAERASEAVPEKLYYEIRLAALKAEREERVAKAALDSAKAELEHYEVTAQIDGVVSRLEVHPGMVSRPGTTVWGEILDLRELDVRCELTFEQVERVAVGQTAEVRRNGQKEVFGTGRVVFVGITADKKNGLVPVLVRLPNPQERLRCEEPVQVRFSTVRKADTVGSKQ
jgi:RND family efflux transporter MFP subunit